MTLYSATGRDTGGKHYLGKPQIPENPLRLKSCYWLLRICSRLLGDSVWKLLISSITCYWNLPWRWCYNRLELTTVPPSFFAGLHSFYVNVYYKNISKDIIWKNFTNLLRWHATIIFIVTQLIFYLLILMCEDLSEKSKYSVFCLVIILQLSRVFTIILHICTVEGEHNIASRRIPA
jgi:hypothetical protein